MNEAIKQITEALDQQMELNFFMAGKLIELSPAENRKQLKKDLHAKLSLLRERTQKATIALEDLVGKGPPQRSSPISRLCAWLKRNT